MNSHQIITALVFCLVTTVTSGMSLPDDVMIRSGPDETDVIIPGNSQILYDYQNGLVVYRFFVKEAKSFGPCYAREMEQGETYIPRAEVENQEDEMWRTTFRKVPREMISNSVEEMCMDVDIYWLEEYEREGLIDGMESGCQRWRTFKICVSGVCREYRFCMFWGSDSE